MYLPTSTQVHNYEIILGIFQLKIFHFTWTRYSYFRVVENLIFNKNYYNFQKVFRNSNNIFNIKDISKYLHNVTRYSQNKSYTIWKNNCSALKSVTVI